MTLKTKLLILVAILTFFAGTTTAIYFYIDNKDEKIENLNKDISVLKDNQTKLTISNKSLKDEVDRLRSENTRNIDMTNRQLDIIRQGEKRINDMETKQKPKDGMTDKELAASNKRQACLADMTLTMDELERCLKS